MKNLSFCITILLLFAGFNGSLTAQPQYYNYSGSGNGSNSFPFNVAGGKDVQLLYLAGDFAQPTPAPAGNIISVAFRINTNLGPGTYTDMTIKLGQSNITGLTIGTFYSGPMTTVYYRSSVVLTGTAGGWLTFVLDTPFAYDPTLSLIVDVGHCGASGTLGGSCAYTNLSGVRRVWSVGGCPFAPYNSSSIYVYNMGFNLGASSPTVVTTAATAVTGTTASLNGTVNANGTSTTVTFEYGLTTAYGTTVPGVPSTVTGNSVTPVTAAITGLLPNTTYHYRVNGTTTSGTVNGGDMSFTTLALAPTVITNTATSITATTATLNGTVTAGGASTTVTFEYGLTAAYGTTVPGVPGTVTGNTPVTVSAALSGLTPNTTYHYRVNGSNSVGNSNGYDSTFYTVTCPMPGTPGPITGPAVVCGNSQGNIYSVAPIVNAQSYAWSVPAGAVITAGDTTNQITVTFGNTPGIVSVYGIDTCGIGPTGSLPVSVLAAPVPVITGPASMCVNSGYFNYSTEAGMTNYTWMISPGGIITYGQGTSQIQVSWPGSGAQWVNVNYQGTSGCYAGTPTVLQVTVDPVPEGAGAISGSDSACGGETGISYSVAPITGATAYVWTLPAGATIASGEWTPSITVDFATGAASGDITVYGNNICGNGTASPPFTVTVTALPADAGAITGPGSVCAGDLGVSYSVPPIANATGYAWTVPAGATIASGSNTSNISVDFGAAAVSGDITVAGTNLCGTGTGSPAFPVTVNQVPPAPVITSSGDTLTSDAIEGNQWYYEGTAIPGATGQTYLATQSGEHWSVVTLNGCSSEESNHIYVIITGVDLYRGGVFTVRPVPNDGHFTVTMTASTQQFVTIQVFNNIGLLVSETANIEVMGQVDRTIDLRPAPTGLYTLVLRSNTMQIVKKIVVIN